MRPRAKKPKTKIPSDTKVDDYVQMEYASMLKDVEVQAYKGIKYGDAQVRKVEDELNSSMITALEQLKQ